MKKQILTLSLCLALTATAALATTSESITTSSSRVTKSTAKTPLTCPKPATEVSLTPEPLKHKKFQEKMAQNRENLYCQLGFTPEQKAKAELLDQQNKESIMPLMTKYKTEINKLKELESKKNCPEDLAKQKKEVKALRTALRNHKETSRKAFEALLNKEQSVKFEALRAERKAQYKKGNKPHQNHLKRGNGEMTPLSQKGPCNKK